MQKPSSSGNILDEQFANSGLNQAQNQGYGGTQRPMSQKPDIRSSQSVKQLNPGSGFAQTGMHQAQSVNSLGSRGNTQRAEIYVKKWVDYSSKYGLGYLLSNGATGVFFNDATKIVLNPRTQY